MSRVNEFKSYEAMVQALGKEEVWRLAERQRANELYRKGRSMRERAIIDAAKKDPRFKEIEAAAKAAVDKQLKK